ncbi:MAG: restriction endonuclease subunit S [Candidatus Thiodiazotropha lotti]
MTLSEVRIDEIASMKYGKMPKKEILADVGYPVYSGYRVTGYAKEFLYSEPKLIVVARGVGGTGDVKISPPNAWITNLSIVMELDEDKVDKKYLLYKLGREPLKEKLNTGAAQAQITIDNLSSYKIRIPDLRTQGAVVQIISKYDDLIENNKRRIELLEESARQLYKEWFVRFRFPGHEHVKIIDGVPEGWEKCQVGDLLTLQRGFDLPVKKRIEGSVPIYASTGINGYHNEYKVKAPGIVTGRSGSLGTVLYVSKDFWPLNTALWVKEFKKVTPYYALFFLRSLKLENYNGGAAVPTLNRNDVHRIDTFEPPEKLLEAFTDHLNPIFKQIDTLVEQNSKLVYARDLLLPKLMNGEVAV